MGERLDQFIEQGPYAVVLFRGPSDGLVAHGTDTSDLQPLHQAPGGKDTGGKRRRIHKPR